MLWIKKTLIKDIDISRINKVKPAKVMLHSAHPKLGLNHIGYWIKAFVDSGVDFSILLRDRESFVKATKAFPKYSILYAKMPIDVEEVIDAQPELKAIFYMANLAKNIHLLRFNHLKHIYIGSKNSDQLAIINKSYRAYDEIWVSSQFQIDKFKNSIDTRHLKFKVIGRPQLKKIFLQHSETNQYKTVTFIHYENRDLSSSFFPFLGKLLLEANIEKTYIKTKSKLYIDAIKQFALMYSLDMFVIKDNEVNYEVTPYSDFIIVDIFMLNIELLAYGVPLLVYVPKEVDIDTLDFVIPKEILYIFSDEKECLKIITNLKENDYLKKKREEVGEYLLDKKASCADYFFLELKNV